MSEERDAVTLEPDKAKAEASSNPILGLMVGLVVGAVVAGLSVLLMLRKKLRS